MDIIFNCGCEITFFDPADFLEKFGHFVMEFEEDADVDHVKNTYICDSLYVIILFTFNVYL
jgi:hypothetical protein